MASVRALRLPVTLAAVAVIAAVAGCASAPSGGPPRRATGSGSQVEAGYVQPLPPPPPTRSWEPTAVVLGFLHASASYAFDPEAAEQYLVPALRKSWNPANGPVAVVGTPTAAKLPYGKPQLGGSQPNAPLAVVKLTGQRLATLSQTGQYQGTPSQNVQYQGEFILAKIGGVWLIDGLPQSQPGLLLTQADFESVYQARNLFFYVPADPQPTALVPDPVYAPLESSNSALNTTLATGLVKGLIQGPGDWLSGATSSAFPPGTKLLKQVTITGHVAEVYLGGAAGHASAQQIQVMQAQLRATLEDRSYSAPLASQVQVYINNRLQVAWPAYNDLVVTPVIADPILVVTGPSGVGQLSENPRANTTPAVRAGAAQIGRGPITAIAGEPTQGHTPEVAVAVQDGAGCAVLLPTPTNGQTSYRPYVLSTSGGACTSLSWDSNGNLWAAAGQGIWVLRSQNRQPVAVDVGAVTAIGQAGSKILAMRMAPDGVRAAILVHTSSGNKLLLAAVRSDQGPIAFGPPISIGAGGANPIAISWYDAYHLAVLTDTGLIFAIPLTGGAGLQPGGLPQPLGAAPDGAQALTTDGSELVVAVSDSGVSHIYASSPASPRWAPVTTASDPVYPG